MRTEKFSMPLGSDVIQLMISKVKISKFVFYLVCRGHASLATNYGSFIAEGYTTSIVNVIE